MWLWVSKVVALLCAGDLSKVYTMSCPNASGKGYSRISSIILAYLPLHFHLDHIDQSLCFLLFPQLQTNWCSGWVVVALLQSGHCSGRKGHRFAPVLYVPNLPILHVWWMNLYDWLLQVGPCEVDTTTSICTRGLLQTYLSFFEWSKISKRVPN